MSVHYCLNNRRRLKTVGSYFKTQEASLPYQRNHRERPVALSYIGYFGRHQPKILNLPKRSFEESNKTIINEESYLDSLEDVVEELLAKNNTFIKRKSEELKKQFCKFWLLNGFCSYRNCKLYHSVQTAFSNEFKSFPSFKALQLLVYVQEHKLFPDITLMLLGMLKVRKRGKEWLAVLTTLIFLITNPEDERFFEFWIALISEFCQLGDFSKNLSDFGFRKILEIITRFVAKDGLTWKLSSMIQVWEKAPFNLRITYWVIEPVLKHHFPNTLLIKVLKHCNEFKIDTEKIYLEIIPKLSIAELSHSDRKILYSFCDTLLHCGFEDFSRLLKKRVNSEGCGSQKNAQLELLKYRLNVRRDWEALGSFLRDNKNCVGDNVAEEIFETITGESFTKYNILIILEKAAIKIDNQGKKIVGLVVLHLLYKYARKKDDRFIFSFICMCDRNDIEIPLDAECKSQWKCLTPAKLAFLIAEIYIEKNKCVEALKFCEKHRLTNGNPMHWSLKNDGDSFPRTRMLKKLFQKLTTPELSQSALGILCKVLDAKTDIPKSLDVNKSIGNIINMNINTGNPQIFDIFPRYDIARNLDINTIRGLIIFFWRMNRQKEAFDLLIQVTETIYNLPRFNKQPLILVTLSTWSTEELTVFFNVFFDKFAAYKFHRGARSFEFEVFIDMRVSTVPNTNNKTVPIFILNEIETSLNSFRKRLRNVLTEICPTLRLNFEYNMCLIDCDSLANHMKERMGKLIEKKFSLG